MCTLIVGTIFATARVLIICLALHKYKDRILDSVSGCSRMNAKSNAVLVVSYSFPFERKYSSYKESL